MTIGKINVEQTIAKANDLLQKEKNISPALRSVIEVLLLLISLLIQRKGLNSRNSSKPPSDDKNRKRGSNKPKSKRKPGGQKGRKGIQLKPVANPDKIEILKLDKRKLPRDTYKEIGYDRRQVIDIETNVIITEYQAQILEGSNGKRYTANFPFYVTRPIQYGPKTKASSVYMSQFQLIPYNRIEDYFAEQMSLSLSVGSVFNFNKEAYEALNCFEEIAKKELINSSQINVDETGININGKRIWLHTACNNKWTHFCPHKKRGSEAMEEIGILPKFKGVLCHDHWKAYYKYACLHSLCNAHHLRELEWSAVEDKQKWASRLKEFLENVNQEVDKAGGKLTAKKSVYHRKRYKGLLADAEKECPPQKIERKKGQRGKLKKTKSRNLLERLIKYQDDVLRFVDNIDVPFTNNQGENDLRMTKVQQKISGCFRSEDGAFIFCRIRAYLITCRKHGIGATEALELLFKGRLPEFVQKD
ncbi:MAG: IS66 family transposase [Desulfobacula sp.]|nr:IS66 family transposase [Desulfobacula sp.]